VSTVSTKQRSSKKGRHGRKARRSISPAVVTPAVVTPAQIDASGSVAAELVTPLPLSRFSLTNVVTDDIGARAWSYASFAILLVAAALRLYALELKPMHHDEGVNGFFFTTLWRQGVYKYDPTNYHGPVLYYLTLPATALFGLGGFALRFVTAAFGVATVWLALRLRSYIGSYGALAAAALIAVSPGAVFYSRYYIHEMLFVFFTLGVVVAALRFHETRRPVFLMLAAASAALLFATKETAFVSIGTLILAWLVAKYLARYQAGVSPYGQRRAHRSGRRADGKRAFVRANRTESLLESPGDRSYAARLIAGPVAIFLLVNIVFYSSFFTNWDGVSGAIQSLKVWSQTGTSDFHGKPFSTYFTLLLHVEAPIFILAAVGSATALFEQKQNRFAIFAGAWGFGLLLAYSLIPYKTPWLMLSFVVPMAIAGGYAIQALARKSWLGWRAPAPALAVAVLAVVIGLYQSGVLNFRSYDDDRYPYVYAHTHRDFHALVSELGRLAEREGNKKINVTVASPEHWPMPWYFRDNPNVGYVGSVAERYDPNTAPVVIGRESDNATEDQSAKLRVALGSEYEKVGVYTLRPGVRLAMFARRDLVGDGSKQ
jgi:uncharacterized protein (TIGR03663 family)